ncbi:hypothetical protein KA107_00390 [Candidatus Pacearchaeota archaeon]|nr:hypothetical protein [Candidatus Pacearchaeota archaeon]
MTDELTPTVRERIGRFRIRQVESSANSDKYTLFGRPEELSPFDFSCFNGSESHSALSKKGVVPMGAHSYAGVAISFSHYLDCGIKVFVSYDRREAYIQIHNPDKSKREACVDGLGKLLETSN